MKFQRSHVNHTKVLMVLISFQVTSGVSLIAYQSALETS